MFQYGSIALLDLGGFKVEYLTGEEVWHKDTTYLALNYAYMNLEQLHNFKI